MAARIFSIPIGSALGALAQRSLDQFAPDFLMFAKAIGPDRRGELPDSLDEAELWPHCSQPILKKLSRPTKFLAGPLNIQPVGENCAASRWRIFGSTLKTLWQPSDEEEDDMQLQRQTK